MKLVCKSCGEVFSIPEDSAIAFSEIAAEIGERVLAKLGLPHVRPPPMPDSVKHMDIKSPDMRNEIVERANQIRREVASGASRKWQCGKCRAVNSYSTDIA